MFDGDFTENKKPGKKEIIGYVVSLILVTLLILAMLGVTIWCLVDPVNAGKSGGVTMADQLAAEGADQAFILERAMRSALVNGLVCAFGLVISILFGIKILKYFLQDLNKLLDSDGYEESEERKTKPETVPVKEPK